MLKKYHGHIMGISWAYHGHIMGISWAYGKNVSNKLSVYKKMVD
jgi:hypothetical protein